MELKIKMLFLRIKSTLTHHFDFEHKSCLSFLWKDFYAYGDLEALFGLKQDIKLH